MTLFKLYFSLILPHLSYFSSVWDPPSNSCDSVLLEKNSVLCFENVSYTTLLSLFGIPSLSVCRSHSKLLFLFKILNHLIYFPPNIFILKPPPHYPIRSYDFLTLFQTLMLNQTHLFCLPPLFGTLYLFTSNLPHLLIVLEPNYLILAPM